MSLVYKIDQSNQADILNHLQQCDATFLANLKKEVDIEAYSNKLFTNAMRFEAWDGEKLVGIVAVYLNEANFAYLTNVSVDQNYTGQRIASTLMDQCIAFCRNSKIAFIRLEVKMENTPAIQLYTKYNFEKRESTDTTQFMELTL